MKVAIIGSGPAAFSVLHGLESISKLEIVVFEHGAKLPEPSGDSVGDATTERAFYDELYRKMKEQGGVGFPPQKRHFLSSIPAYQVNNERRFPESLALGGLSNFWGATLLPMTSMELNQCGFKDGQLDSHYRRIARLVGIAGNRDNPNEYYSNEYSVRQAVPTLRGIQGLARNLQSSVNDNCTEFSFFSGVNRVAVDTDLSSKNRCTLCGECMIGCIHGSVFNAKVAFQHQESENNIKLVSEKVLKIIPKQSEIIVRTHTADYVFNKVFLCAGTVGTSEIILRSFSPNSTITIQDNSICQMPILNLSSDSAGIVDRYFSLSQIITVVQKKNSVSPKDVAQVQIYPNFDYIWRCAMPRLVWPLISPIIKLTRDRLIWARLYTHGDFGWHYGLKIGQSDQLEIQEIKKPDRSVASEFYRAIRKQLGGSSYHLLDFFPIFSKSSSHLAAEKPSELKVDFSGEIEKGVYVCDGAYFNHSPTTSLTFTVMANAYRIALAVHDEMS
ncbi:MAG: hypothetical protein IPK04_06465 [Bdellovibrionales bacterium]|nr:hypothetical protein [Bdellovibrionales bacterium]